MRDLLTKVITKHLFTFLSRNQWLLFIVIVAFHILYIQDRTAVNALFIRYISDTTLLVFINNLMTVISVLAYFYYSLKKFCILNENLECLKEIRRMEAKDVRDKLLWLLLIKYGITVFNICVVSKPFFEVFMAGYIHILFFPIFLFLTLMRFTAYMSEKLNGAY